VGPGEYTLPKLYRRALRAQQYFYAVVLGMQKRSCGSAIPGQICYDGQRRSRPRPRSLETGTVRLARGV